MIVRIERLDEKRFFVEVLSQAELGVFERVVIDGESVDSESWQYALVEATELYIDNDTVFIRTLSDVMVARHG